MWSAAAFDAAANPSKFPAGLFSVATGSYDFPAAHVAVEGVYTNKPPGGVAYRCSFRVTEAVHMIERMVDILRRATRAMENDPKLSAAVVTALSSNDSYVARCQEDLGEIMTRIQLRAFPEDFDPATASRISRALGHVWFSSLLAWVNGWSGIKAAGDELASASHLMLDQYE